MASQATVYATAAELEAGLDEVRRSPRHVGRVEMIVRRPGVNQREVVVEADLDRVEGLVGDSWRARGDAHLDMQLNLMNSRVIELVAGSRDRWPLAGDQLFVDLDLSVENLPAGTRLAIGTALIEVTAEPHTGCRKFMNRYGADALKFVNSPVSKQLRLRGLCARVVQPGVIHEGDAIQVERTPGEP